MSIELSAQCAPHHHSRPLLLHPSMRAQPLPQLGPEFLHALLGSKAFSRRNSLKPRAALPGPIFGMEFQDVNGSIISTLGIPDGFEVMMSVAIDLPSDGPRAVPVDAAVDVDALEVDGAA